MSAQPKTKATRFVVLMVTVLLGLGAASLFIATAVSGTLRPIEMVLAVLIFMTTTWLAWGAMLAFSGLVAGQKPAHQSRVKTAAISGRTAILFPVYNEDPTSSFARVAAMDAALAGLGHTGKFDFAILSDTTDDGIAAEEEEMYVRLVKMRDASGRIFYRRRDQNTGRKAGNIKDFIETSGAAYDFALILDADSLMEAETILEMVRRMEADPSVGLLQTLPKIINARSLFGRALQFSVSVYAPYFARGLEVLQGPSGPFWGHNAIVRVAAFAQACGLPKLEGKAPFGGHILSHDYVEAALLARAGWSVRLDTDLEGSFEEGPEDVIAYAKRDRRWCQGNIQHAGIIRAPRLLGWNRFTFAQGVMTYVAPLLWFLFILGSIYAAATNQTATAEGTGTGAYGTILILWVVGLLFLPKILIYLAGIATRRHTQSGGSIGAGLSTFAELLLSSILAPITLAFQLRSVLQVLSGSDGGWPATDRDAGEMTLEEAFAASYWISLLGMLLIVLCWSFTPSFLIWLTPITLPLLFAPFLIWLTAKNAEGGLLLIPSEEAVPPIVAAYRKIHGQWMVPAP